MKVKVVFSQAKIETFEVEVEANSVEEAEDMVLDGIDFDEDACGFGDVLYEFEVLKTKEVK